MKANRSAAAPGDGKSDAEAERGAASAAEAGGDGAATPDERLLQLLRGGDFVSGERIAEALGVSRAAVGKRVAELRKRDFAIAAAPRRGYRLDGEPDALDAAVVQPRLVTHWLGRAWRHLPTTGSTNDEAAAWARAGAPAGAVVVADAQTRGRGRLGRRWHSPPGASLYFSVVLRPPLPPHRVPPLTLAAGVAVAEALTALDITPQLKWPNDVLLDGKKVAGILTEMSSDLDRVHHVVVGIGVNLNTRDFPEELAAIATSAALVRGLPVVRADFAAALCARLEHWVDRFVAEGASVVATAWKQHARIFGRRVRVTAGRDVIEGVAEDLDDDGALRLRLDDGRTTRVIAGEVTPLA
jgi:BirA family biotin operon repressor/biotin-[acetyl-CoA-carboxylase] ligase